MNMNSMQINWPKLKMCFFAVSLPLLLFTIYMCITMNFEWLHMLVSSIVMMACHTVCVQCSVHNKRCTSTHTHTQCAQMLIFSMRFDQQVHINAHGFELSKWLTFIAIDFTAIVYNTWNSNDDDSCPSGGVKCRNDYNTHICTHQLAWTIDDHWLLNGPSKYTHIHFFFVTSPRCANSHQKVVPIRNTL